MRHTLSHIDLLNRMIGVEKQGQVVRMVNLSQIKSPPANLSKRGDVTSFSRKSRRRMIDLMARLDLKGKRVVFLTLTFHYTHSKAKTKAAFKRFLSYLSYHYPDTSGVWRVEFQGRSTPHYHLILIDLPFWKHSELRATWMQCTREDKSGARIEWIHSERMCMFYVSKYCAKVYADEEITLFINAPYQQKEEEKWTGRMWGVINKRSIPFAPRVVAVCVDEEVLAYFQWCCGCQFQRKSKHRLHTSRAYSDEAGSIFTHILTLGGFICSDIWHEMLERKQLSPSQRTKASYFFAGFNTHH